MRLFASILIAAFCLPASPGPVRAADVLLAPGITTQGDATARVGLGWDWSRRWFESESGHLSGYWNLGYTWWQRGRLFDEAHSLSISPVFVYQFAGSTWRPFVEFGVGAAAFSRSRVGEQRLGSRIHFEDRIGFGVRIDERQKLILRAIHYSNAGLKDPNDGIESWSLVYSRRL